MRWSRETGPPSCWIYPAGTLTCSLQGTWRERGEEALEQRLKKTYDVLKTGPSRLKKFHIGIVFSKRRLQALLSSRLAGTTATGHPHQETLDRLRREGCSVYQTAQSGSVTIVTDGRTMRIRRFLP